MKLKRAFIMLLPLLAAVGVNAQSNDDYDFETNLTLPDVPTGKIASQVRNHMKNIKNAIAKHGFEVSMERNDEVVKITMPCSALFAPNDTVLMSQGDDLKHLSKLSDLLEFPTMYKIVVAVFNDDTGDELYAENLTMARANAVYEFLLEISGKEEVNVVPYGIGADEFLVENNSIVNRSRNRRVEIYIIPESDMITTAKSGKL